MTLKETRQPITATSRAYRQALAARAFTNAPRTEAPGAEATSSTLENDSLENDSLESALRRYVEMGGTSGKANDPYTDEEMGLR